MKVLITGATGFVGRAVARRLQRDNHEVCVITRSAEGARSRLGAKLRIVQDDGTDATISEAVEGQDAIIHLAGEPLIGGRWTDARKRAFVDSRVGFANRLIDAMRRADKKPGVFLSASAVGFYGDRQDEELDESSIAGQGFVADLCRQWEQSALQAETLGARVAVLRTGVVLGQEGGALPRMKTPFSLGLGGRLGTGRQWMPWIHIADLVEMFATALTDARWSGVFNATAPSAVTNAEFTQVLGKALNRPTPFPVPQFALRAALSGAAEILLGSQRVQPKAALARRFAFTYPNIDDAVGHLLAS